MRLQFRSSFRLAPLVRSGLNQVCVPVENGPAVLTILRGDLSLDCLRVIEARRIFRKSCGRLFYSAHSHASPGRRDCPASTPNAHTALCGKFVVLEILYRIRLDFSAGTSVHLGTAIAAAGDTRLPRVLTARL